MSEHHPEYSKPEQATASSGSMEPAGKDEQVADVGLGEKAYLGDDKITFKVTRRVHGEIDVISVTRDPQISRRYVEEVNARARADGERPLFGRWADVDLDARRAEIAARRHRSSTFTALLRRLGVAN